MTEMKRFKSNCFWLAVVILIGILPIACSPGERKESQEQLLTFEDTLNYRKMDYDSMRDYFRTDTLFLSTLSKEIEVGDTNSIKVRKLLMTEFESREKVGLTEAEIEALIFFYHTSKTVTEKFEELESRLSKTDTNAVRVKTDSIVKAIEKLKAEMKGQK
jgi:hypothetical protein